MKKSDINGINIYSPKSRNELIDYAYKNKSILIAINAEKILHSDSEIRQLINRNVGYPDGMGAVWALKKRGLNKTIKIPGCELWLDIISKYYKSKRFYLIGAKQNVIDETVFRLKKDFKGIKILNYRNGYLKTEIERLELIKDLQKLKPDFIFVAMGSPKQEQLMELMQKNYSATYIGLGGSFDVYTQKLKRAPKWFIDNNLEWAYRLIKEPSRLNRQIHLLRFFILLQLNKF